MTQDDADGRILTVTDLKQFAYCPRIVYYTYCLPLLRPQTYKMVESQQAHQEETLREERRSLRPYGLPDGARSFDVRLRSARLGLRGRVDLVINTGQELIPVDYKLTENAPGPHFRLQLAAYGLLLAETSALPVRRGFVYAIPLRQAIEVPLTARLRRQVERLTADMRQVVMREEMPAAPARRGRCWVCEFRRFCNDL
jgi:CRISPR-associated exonuclease Cas4